MHKRVFLIHGFGGHPDEHWLPWLRQELVSRGFLVTVPPMPDTDHPNMVLWQKFMEDIVGHCDENTYFVGHSIGCQAILRYIQSLLLPARVGGAVFVAGFETLNYFDENERVNLETWIKEPIHWEAIRGKSKHFTAVFSDDDAGVPLENMQIFHEKLGAKTILLHKRGHFCAGDGIVELPEALDALLEMSSKNP